MIAAIDDPIASASGQFPLSAPSDTPAPEDKPSPVGLRPWGLRNLTVASVLGHQPQLAAHYDHDQQVAVNRQGEPLITMAGPTANTTSSVDGEDPPSAEDWNNDFYPDEPFQV